MKSKIGITLVMLTIVAALGGRSAYAVFDLMQIEQVIGGVNGDTSAQAIQLRMREDFQSLVSFTKLVAHDATGSNPILLIDFSTDVANDALGDRILITSANFAHYVDPMLTPDFTFTNLLPASYLAAGSITFEDDFGVILWRLSWGGVSYTGPTTGELINDADGDFGPPFGGPLPSSDLQALVFPGAASDLSTQNNVDYALTGVAAVFTNNAGGSMTVTSLTVPAVSEWGMVVLALLVVSAAVVILKRRQQRSNA